jgi:integrase
MGSVRQSPRTVGRRKGEVRWEVRYRDPSGRQRTKGGFETKAAALAWLGDNESSKRHNTWLDPADAKIILREWVEEWAESVQSLRRSTRARDENYIETYILPEFGDAPIGSITQPDVKRWASALSAGKPPAHKPLRPATVVKAAQILGKIMAAAVDAKCIAASPCHNLDLPKIELEEMRFLNRGEVERLVANMHLRYRSLVLVSCYGGLRMGELAGLRWKRIDFLKSSVEVTEIADETDGVLGYGPPKTKASKRVVKLPRHIIEILAKEYESVILTADDDRLFRRELDSGKVAQRGHLRRITELKGQYLVWTSPEGLGLRINSWRQRFWRPAVEVAGLAPLRPHDMRHTAVAFWIASGWNVLRVSRAAGHSSTSFTMDRYGHLFPEDDEAAMRLLEAYLETQGGYEEASVVSLDAGDDA